MTAEQLEELLSDLTHGSKLRRDSAHDDLSELSASLARKVIAAEKLVEEVGMYLTGSTGHRDLARAVTAYREARK